jgi:hypothetical protein
VKELFDALNKGLNEIFDYRSITKNTVAYIGLIDGKRHTIFHVIPGETDSDRMASIEKGIPIIKAANKYNIFLHLTDVPLRSTPAGEKCVRLKLLS